ncbi:response regulator transcription factor [Planctomycetaceae bacterium SH139]
MPANILIIDDHGLICLAVRQLVDFESDLHCLATCADLQTAEEVLSAEQVDVAVCDLNLGQGNVFKFVTRLTKLVSTRFLISSALRPELYAPLCRRAGASGYIHKSAAPNVLVDAIRKLACEHAEDERPWVGEVLHDHRPGSLLCGLSDREWQILLELGRGNSTKEIARKFFVSDKTVESHRLSIKRKLAFESKDQLVSFAAELSEVMSD